MLAEQRELNQTMRGLSRPNANSLVGIGFSRTRNCVSAGRVDSVAQTGCSDERHTDQALTSDAPMVFDRASHAVVREQGSHARRA